MFSVEFGRKAGQGEAHPSNPFPVDPYGKYRCFVKYMCAFLMKLNVIKLLANLLLLGHKPLDVEVVWDVVENIRPNSPDKFQVRPRNYPRVWRL